MQHLTTQGDAHYYIESLQLNTRREIKFISLLHERKISFKRLKMDDLSFFCFLSFFLSTARNAESSSSVCCVHTKCCTSFFFFSFFFFVVVVVVVEHPLFPLSSQPQRTDEAIAAAAAAAAAVVERAKLSQQIKERHLKQRVTQTNLQIFPVSIC